MSSYTVSIPTFHVCSSVDEAVMPDRFILRSKVVLYKTLDTDTTEGISLLWYNNSISLLRAYYVGILSRKGLWVG